MRNMTARMRKALRRCCVLFCIIMLVISSGCGNSEDSEHSHEHEGESHSDGLKIKLTEENREASADEQKIIDRLYISNLESDGLEYGNEIYTTMTLTGTAMPERSIYSVRELEELVRISFVNQQMNELELFEEKAGYYGLDFVEFLELCGMDTEKGNTYITCTSSSGQQTALKYETLTQEKCSAILTVGDAAGPFGKQQNAGDSIQLVVFKGDKLCEQTGISSINAGKGKKTKDPEYQYHNHKPYKDSLDIALTVEIYQDGAEYLGATESYEFTTAELEDMMRDNPDKVVGNYYGTIGNQTTYAYAGTGGWMDYFEGVDFLWLMQEKMGIEALSGHAEMVGRDGEVYNTIDDLSYFDYGSKDGKADAYYVMTQDGVKLPGCIPMIAVMKNGYPILKEHEHESEAYIAYNHLNQSLEEHGVDTEVGVVKNHNGPFAACFGNLDGYYGGEQMETSGDCVLIRLYVK